jgi:hypothetical protein
MNNLKSYIPLDTGQPQHSNEISIYNGPLTMDVIINSAAKIRAAFPALPIEFYEVFDERIKGNGFCNERLLDAVNHVIDHCVYPTPTIAQFISFDRRFKAFKYEEMLSKLDEFGAEIWLSYFSIKYHGMEKPLWVHINDIKEFKLEQYKTI